MKHFFFKLILFIAPLIIGFFTIEYGLRSIPNDYILKNEFLKNNASQIEHLFLGSSHTYYGINPEFIEGKSFNASHISQSIDYDFAIFNKFKNQLTNLKTIIIPVDYFTLFIKTSTGEESWRIKNYEIYYGINKSFRLKNHFELLNFKFSTNIMRLVSFLKGEHNSYITCTKLGYGNRKIKQKDLVKTGKQAAKRHAKKDNRHFEENTTVIYQFIQFAKERDLKIIFFTSPAYKTYTENLNPKQLNVSLRTIEKISDDANLTYVNFLADQDFDSSDFRDADHLNQKGAHKFSLKIDTLLKLSSHPK